MKTNLMMTVAAGALLVGGLASAALAEDLTLCWAAWDPANALIELSKDFETQSGNKMHFEFVPWPNFADRMLNELNSGGKLCDLLIGDSQWIGGAAENGQYLKLNDFFDANAIKMADFIPATVTGYSEWPKGTPNYYALPAFGDVVGWTYRKDWFDRPEIQAEFKAKYGRDLGVPATLEQLRDIAQFFQGRDIDGKKVYGAAIYTERGSEGITMGVTNALYNYGFQYENPAKPYDLEGFVNSDGAVAGLEFYKSLYDTATPPGSSNWYMGEDIDAYKSGQVALQMNFAFVWPGVESDPNVGGGKSGYFANPAGPAGQFAQLGGQGISVVANSEHQQAALDYIKWFAQPSVQAQWWKLGGQGISVVANSDHQQAALDYIKWFAQPSVQAQWWKLGGYSALNAVVNDPGFAASQPYAQTFLDSMAIVKDFWAEPAYADLLLAMQERMHNYVVAGQGTAKEALDGVVQDWTKIFKDEGKL